MATMSEAMTRIEHRARAAAKHGDSTLTLDLGDLQAILAGWHEVSAFAETHERMKAALQKVVANDPRSISLARQALGMRHGNAKLTLEQIAEIRQDDRSLSEIANHYGVSRSQISRLLRRRSSGPARAN